MRLIAKNEWLVNLSSEDSRDLLRNHIRGLIRVGGNYSFKMQPWKRKRSNPQNSYYRGVVIPLMTAGFRELGWQYTDEDTHEEMKRMFLRKSIPNEKTGEEKLVVGSTTELNTVEFNNYLAQCIQFSSEHLYVPIPDPI